VRLIEELQDARFKIGEYEEKEAKLYNLVIQYRLAADRVSKDKQLYHTLMDNAKNIEDILNGKAADN
jgi:hypothetical protein